MNLKSWKNSRKHSDQNRDSEQLLTPAQRIGQAMSDLPRYSYPQQNDYSFEGNQKGTFFRSFLAAGDGDNKETAAILLAGETGCVQPQQNAVNLLHR